ncbi:MAG: DUF488 domain-containing protein, partial [Deltaproteobacteria bacterium]|nr:DUF488 domain-containing protein [Deltaproteobacteria bacterium]
MKIYSLGTSTRTIEEFMGILKAYDIAVAADVRSFPQSRFPHFQQAELTRFLKEERIDYVYLGKELGGYRRGGYESYVGTPSYNQGLERLEEIAKGKTTVFFCAERLPWRCHRRFIGASLRKRGWEVVYIIEEGRVWHPKDRSSSRSG